MDEEALERVIRALVKRMYSHETGSPEFLMAERQLRGLRYTYELAGGIIEEADPDGWGCYCRPP